MPLSYDEEAEGYDATRGGDERAAAAAEAVEELLGGVGRSGSRGGRLGAARGTALDVAGGTGIVSAELAARGWSVLVADASAGMLGVASRRLPGRVLQARADRLPVRTSAIDVVTTIWLLHLLPVAEADRVVEEAARVLRPGGAFVTTVDKDLAHGRVRRTNGDHRDRVEQVARRFGLVAAGSTSFDARTRWRSGPHGQRFAVAAFRRAPDQPAFR